MLLYLALAGLMGCTPKIKNDHSIGKIEVKTYTSLVERLTNDMKRQFGGNMYQSEKITPVETADALKIGIPNGIAYSFKNDNSKYVKGDLNNDKLSDLIICADMTVAKSLPVKKYFVFLQSPAGYQYFAECKGDEMVAANCGKNDLNNGVFNLDSIAGGLMIGNSNYQGNHEAYYRDFSYRCATEKYKLNVASKKLELVSQSDLLKKNEGTGEYEMVERR